MKKHKHKASNPPVILLWSLLTSIGITLLGTAVLTFLIAGEKLPLEGSHGGILGILLLAAIAGAWVAVKGSGEKPLLMALISGGLYYLMLLCCTAMFFDGQYQGLGVTALAVLGGSMTAVLLTMRKGQSKTKKRYLRK